MNVAIALAQQLLTDCRRTLIDKGLRTENGTPLSIAVAHWTAKRLSVHGG